MKSQTNTPDLQALIDSVVAQTNPPSMTALDHREYVERVLTLAMEARQPAPTLPGAGGGDALDAGNLPAGNIALADKFDRALRLNPAECESDYHWRGLLRDAIAALRTPATHNAGAEAARYRWMVKWIMSDEALPDDVSKKIDEAMDAKDFAAMDAAIDAALPPQKGG